jgi:chloramphenicol-sensitive protein RarD
MFLLGVFVYDEPFSTAHLVTFVAIWAGLAVYSADALGALAESRKSKREI